LLSGPDAVKHFVDVVSRGGNLLLNVGLTAAGTVPPLQRRTLEHLAAWNAANGHAVFGSTTLDPAIAGPSDAPWSRWTRTGSTANVFVDATGDVTLAPTGGGLDVASARLADGSPVAARRVDGGIVLTLPVPELAGPILVTFGIVPSIGGE
jgi:alpha-L-fucosidase